MTTISEILYQDSWKYLEQLSPEELIELVQEHRTVQRVLESSRQLKPTKVGG